MAVIYENACPRCSHPLLVMMVQIGTESVFAECENCHNGFWGPAVDDPFTTEDVRWERRRASWQEARDAGWLDLGVQGQMPPDEGPSPQDVAAFFVLDRVPTEHVPWIAARWLADGLDGERLRELAGEHGDDTYKIKDLLPLALSEIGVPLPPTAEAVDQTFTYLARRCLAGELSERDVAAMVDHIVAAGGFGTELYDLPLGGIYGLDDEWVGGWGRTEEFLCRDVRQACQAQLAR